MMNQAAWDALSGFAAVIHHQGPEPAAKTDLLALLFQARGLHHQSDALWERGIQVTTAGPALARDVAETTLGLMIVGLKRIWPLGQHVCDGGWRESRYWTSRELDGKSARFLSLLEQLLMQMVSGK